MSVTYQELKKFARPYTALQLAQKTTWHKEENRVSEDGKYLTNGAVVLVDPSPSLLKRNTILDEVLSKRVEALFKLYSNRQPTRPVKLLNPGEVIEQIDIKTVRFETDEGDYCFVNARYVRMLWDRCPNCDFRMALPQKAIFAYSPSGEFIGCVMPMCTPYYNEVVQ